MKNKRRQKTKGKDEKTKKKLRKDKRKRWKIVSNENVKRKQ